MVIDHSKNAYKDHSNRKQTDIAFELGWLQKIKIKLFFLSFSRILRNNEVVFFLLLIRTIIFKLRHSEVLKFLVFIDM